MGPVEKWGREVACRLCYTVYRQVCILLIALDLLLEKKMRYANVYNEVKKKTHKNSVNERMLPCRCSVSPISKAPFDPVWTLFVRRGSPIHLHLFRLLLSLPLLLSAERARGTTAAHGEHDQDPVDECEAGRDPDEDVKLLAERRDDADLGDAIDHVLDDDAEHLGEHGGDHSEESADKGNHGGKDGSQARAEGEGAGKDRQEGEAGADDEDGLEPVLCRPDDVDIVNRTRGQGERDGGRDGVLDDGHGVEPIRRRRRGTIVRGSKGRRGPVPQAAGTVVPE